MDRKYTKDEKLSKLFATVLQLEEHQRMMQSRLSELAGFKMALRPKNIVDLLQSERRDMDADIAWAKGVLNAAEPITNAQSAPECITSEGGGPINFHSGGDRWTFDRGAMPGEPFGFLDVVDGDLDTAVAAIREMQVPGKVSFFEVADRQGDVLSSEDTASKAAQLAMDVLAEVDTRLLALPRLQQQAGAAYTLYQVASKALQCASGDANAVNWSQVHQDVFAKAIGQDKQPVDTVLDAIKRHSPGAVAPEQIAVVEAMRESREVVQTTKLVENLLVGDRVDLKSCPLLKEHPSADFEYGLVAHVERETAECIVIGYEGIDHIGYPVGTVLTLGQPDPIAVLEASYIEAASELRSAQAKLGNTQDETSAFVSARDALREHPAFPGTLPKTYFSGGSLDPEGVDGKGSDGNSPDYESPSP